MRASGRRRAAGRGGSSPGSVHWHRIAWPRRERRARGAPRACAVQGVAERSGVGADRMRAAHARRRRRAVWATHGSSLALTCIHPAVSMPQGIGYLIAGTVTIICAKIWEGNEGARDFLWRTCLVHTYVERTSIHYILYVLYHSLSFTSSGAPARHQAHPSAPPRLLPLITLTGAPSLSPSHPSLASPLRPRPRRPSRTPSLAHSSLPWGAAGAGGGEASADACTLALARARMPLF